MTSSVDILTNDLTSRSEHTLTATHHTRMQHAVGHGFFHTAAVTSVDRQEHEVFRYVYDCGSMGSDSEFRRLAIDTWASGHSPAVTSLDLVYISHMDIDHRSGLEQLVNDRDVGTYILPLVDPVERLMSWASHQVRGEFVSEIDRLFVVNPVSALRTLSPESRIVFVVPGDFQPPDGWLVDPEPAPGTGQDEPPSMTDLTPHWSIGAGGPTSISGPGVYVVSDADPILMAFPRGGPEWILDHYVDPGIVAQRDTFRQTLEHLLKDDPSSLDAILSDPTKLGPMLQVSSASRADNLIIQAYESMYSTKRPDLNLTSLCLYSGPIPGADFAGHTEMGRNTPFGEWVVANHGRVGWLGTGDAKLNVDKRIDPFLTKFATHAGSVRTFTLPHHGSDHSLRADVLDSQPAVEHVCSGQSRKHPGEKVKGHLADRGISAHVVGKTDGYEEQFCLVEFGSSCGAPWLAKA